MCWTSFAKEKRIVSCFVTSLQHQFVGEFIYTCRDFFCKFFFFNSFFHLINIIIYSLTTMYFMTQIIKGFLNFLQGFMYCHHGRRTCNSFKTRVKFCSYSCKQDMIFTSTNVLELINSIHPSIFYTRFIKFTRIFFYKRTRFIPSWFVTVVLSALSLWS